MVKNWDEWIDLKNFSFQQLQGRCCLKCYQIEESKNWKPKSIPSRGWLGTRLATLLHFTVNHIFQKNPNFTRNATPNFPHVALSLKCFLRTIQPSRVHPIHGITRRPRDSRFRRAATPSSCSPGSAHASIWRLWRGGTAWATLEALKMEELGGRLMDLWTINPFKKKNG